MALFVWLMIFVFALVPGMAVGALIGVLFDRWGIAVGVCVVLAASYVTSLLLNPVPELHRHIEDLVVYVPPFAAATLLGWWAGRKSMAMGRWTKEG